MRGPSVGPQKGVRVNNIIGASMCAGAKRSATVAAATVRNEEPVRPQRKRAINRVWMFFATAQGIVKRRKKNMEMI